MRFPRGSTTMEASVLLKRKRAEETSFARSPSKWREKAVSTRAWKVAAGMKGKREAYSGQREEKRVRSR